MAVITRTSDRDRELLRRSALAADQGPNDEQQARAYPRFPLDILGDPQDPTNVSFPFLRLMSRDHMVAMGLHFIDTPVLRAPFYYEDDGRGQAAAFADNLIRPIYGDLVSIILRMVSFGYSAGARNFQTVAPNWTYVIGDEERPVWTQQGVDALIYKDVIPLRPENALPVWKNGSFNGIKYDSRYGGVGYFIINGERKPDIDLLHSFWATHDKAKEDGTPFGYPRIAYCAPIFHMYRYIWTLLGRAFENNADPGPVVRYPRDELPGRGANGEPVSNVQTALKLGTRRRSGSTIALPSEPYTDIQDKPTGITKWGIEYPKSETSFGEIQAFLGFLESAKLRALWIQEQGLIEGSGAQSNRNVASEFGQQRDESQALLMMQVDDVIDKAFVRPAMAMNMPWYEGPLTKKTIGPGHQDEEIVRQILQLAGQGDVRNFRVDVQRLLSSHGMPMLGMEAWRQQRDEVRAAASAAVTPAVTPTQGRRALVTQTGFDREHDRPIMSYHELGGRIELAGDADFVSSLPRTDAFSDRQVVAATRDLRSSAVAFLSWAYGDFARYLGKKKTLNLAELADELEREALAEAEGEELADRTRLVVDKLINGWRPKVEKISEFSRKSRTALGRVFDRTARLHLSRLGSNARTSSVDAAAAAWLDDRGVELVSGILETTRQQLAELLSDGVRAGKTPKEIAADIREHFDGFPAARAAAIARTEIGEAYNFATVTAGMDAGVVKCQLVDGTDDKPCRLRNGKILDLKEALKERLNHTNCTLFIRLLPRASSKLEVRREKLDGFQARYDQATETILLSLTISQEDESAYLIALGDELANVSPVIA